MSNTLTEDEKRQLIAAAELAADNVCKNIKRLYVEALAGALEGGWHTYDFKDTLSSISNYDDIEIWLEYSGGCWFDNLPAIPTKPQP